MAKKSQIQKIIEYIQENGSVTVGEIQRKLNINAATARLTELRWGDYDHILADRWVKRDGVRYKEYFFVGEEDEEEEYTEFDAECDKFDEWWHSDERGMIC